MRRRRKRTSISYRLSRFLRELMSERRRRQFRVIDRKRFIVSQCVLIAVAVTALGLSVSVIVRSIRTAKLNQKLVALHTVEAGAAPAVEIAAGPVEARRENGLKLSQMGLPDGSPIQTTSARTAALHNVTGDILPDMLKLLRSNGDTVGWLYINGVVSLPVVYRDNQYYLTHDFSGHHNTSGTLFLDEAHPIAANAQNLLIHGHSMYDGSMFGLLTHYQKRDTLLRHPLISFSTLYEKETYAVFAVLKVSSKAGDKSYFNYYDHAAFASDQAFNDYILELRRRSLFDIPVDVKPSDALLTLSTCIDDDRLMVVARKMRADETKDELVSEIEESV